jgi:hypothetical protein
MNAPQFTLEHINGQTMSLTEFLDKPVVLVFAGKSASEQAKQISKTVASNLRGGVNLISIMRLAGVPKMARPLARRDLKKVYEEASNEAAADRVARGAPVGDLARTVVMLGDWDGSVSQAYGVTGGDDEAVAIIVDQNGMVQAEMRGADAGQRIVAHFGAT